MAKKPVLTGDLPKVTVSGKEYTLKPSLSAARKITQALGGLRPAFMKCNDLDPDALAAVVAAGAGLTFKDQAEADAFTESLFFKTNRDDYIPGLTDFLILMLAGGKKPDESAEATSEGNG